MLDHHDAPEGAAADRQPRAGDRPLSDREVPLPAMAAVDRAQAAVHAWLDGELSEAEAHAHDPARVRFWGELTVQVEVHRTRSAPASLLDTVMAALPSTAPAARLADAPLADARPADAPAARSAAPRVTDRSAPPPR